MFVVDNEPDITLAFSMALEDNGFVVDAFNDPLLALESFQEEWEIIWLELIDVKMPKMNGRELAERLMPLRPGVKVLYISGHTDSATVNEMALQRGANFLQKPFTPDRLTTKVRKVLDSPVTP